MEDSIRFIKLAGLARSSSLSSFSSDNHSKEGWKNSLISGVAFLRYPVNFNFHAETLSNVSSRRTGCGVIVLEDSNSSNVCLKCVASVSPFFPHSLLGGSLANSSNLALALYRFFNAFSCGGSLRRCCRKSIFGRPAGKFRLHLKNSNFSCSILSWPRSVFVGCEIVWSSRHRDSSAQKTTNQRQLELAFTLARSRLNRILKSA